MKDQMVENIVVDFATKKKTMTLKQILEKNTENQIISDPGEQMKQQHLTRTIKELQTHLKSLFFDQTRT